MISKKSELRLHATLRGILPTAVLVLFGATGWMVYQHQVDVTAVCLSVIGLALGTSLGVPLGRLIPKNSLSAADHVLPFLFGLLFFLFAFAPIQPARLFPNWQPTQDLRSVLACILASLPLGVCFGFSWVFRRSKTVLASRDRHVFSAIGAGLGGIMALIAARAGSLLQAAALVNVVIAPVIWPILPTTTERSLLARMLLTLVVVISTMVLLFL